MSDFTEKILSTIKSKHIAPKPRWQFLLQRSMVWVAAVLSVIIGSIAFSVMIFRIVNNDWEVIKFVGRSPVQYFFSTLPYVWIAIIVLFVALAYYNARHTKGAYKYQAYWFVVGSIIISMALGGLFYAFGLGPRLNALADRLPLLHGLMHDRDAKWLEIDKGLLAGEITEILNGDGGGLFSIVDFDGKPWSVRSGDEYIPPPLRFVIETGVQIRMIGEQIDANTFAADRVMPYHIGPGMIKGKFPSGMRNGGLPRLPIREPGEIKQYKKAY